MPDDTPEFDVFISHASEDKADVARPLYDALSARGLNVWLDELQLTVGDSLRQEIDQALSRSRFGLVVLSPDFFSKQWPGKELDGLTALEIQRGKMILPVWHNVSYDDVLGYSPTLADKLAANTASGIDDVAEQIIAAVQKAGVVVSEPPPADDSVRKTATPNDGDSSDWVDDPAPVPPTPEKSGFFSRLNQLQGLFGLLAVIIGAAALYLATSNGNTPVPPNAPEVASPDEVDSMDSDQVDKPKAGSTDIGASGGMTPAETDEPGSVASATPVPDEKAVTNAAPVAKKDFIRTDNKTPVSGNLFRADYGGEDHDPDGDRITVSRVNGSADSVGQTLTLDSGSTIVVQANGDFEFDPTSGFKFLVKPDSSSADKVTYSIVDASGAESVEVASMFSVKKRMDPGDTFRDCDDCPEMVVIPAGEFMMGSPESEVGRRDREGPQHEVVIGEPFALGRYEVTVGQFDAFVMDTDYKTEAERSDGCRFYDFEKREFVQKTDRHWQSPGFAQDKEHPIVCVSHSDAEAYVEWLSEKTGVAYRLPSEAEWEYAARAGMDTARYWGDSPDDACAYANGADEALKKTIPGYSWPIHACLDRYDYTAPVADTGFKANPFGLSHMLGNVWEWTADCWHEDYDGAPLDSSVWLESNSGDCDRRVLRGGGWNNLPENLRAANRSRGNRGFADDGVGFRLARTL